MATRGLESRFARMSVNDENDPGDGSKAYLKSKVWVKNLNEKQKLTSNRQSLPLPYQTHSSPKVQAEPIC
jgi:hypothetical protein